MDLHRQRNMLSRFLATASTSNRRKKSVSYVFQCFESRLPAGSAPRLVLFQQLSAAQHVFDPNVTQGRKCFPSDEKLCAAAIHFYSRFDKEYHRPS